MRTLYEAANLVEAHMLADLLKQEGLQTHVQGEYLQGGVGELQANALVRLMIDEADYPRARAVVDAWDAAQPRDPVTSSPASDRQRTQDVLLGALIGGALVWLAHQL